jgi:hypothetical protein
VDLTFIRKDPLSNPGGSPTVYTTGERTLIVQGWKLTDEKARTQMAIPSHEDAVEIPVRMVPIVVEALLELFQQAAGQDTIKREKENRDTGVPGTTPTGIVATGVAACSIAA